MRHYSPLWEYWEYPVERYMWDGLRKEWPQLNENTTIQLTDSHTVYLTDMPEFNVADQMETKRVWKPGIGGYFYRVLGAVFNEPEWVKRFGETEVQDIRASVPFPRPRELHLRQFGCDIMGEQHYGAFAYDAKTDTLFMRKFR